MDTHYCPNFHWKGDMAADLPSGKCNACGADLVAIGKPAKKEQKVKDKEDEKQPEDCDIQFTPAAGKDIDFVCDPEAEK